MRRLTPGNSDARFENEVAASLRRRLQNRPFAKYRQAISSIIASESGSMLLARPDLSQHPYRLDDSSVMRVWTLIDAGSNVVAHIQLPNSYVPKVFKKMRPVWDSICPRMERSSSPRYDIGGGNLLSSLRDLYEITPCRSRDYYRNAKAEARQRFQSVDRLRRPPEPHSGTLPGCATSRAAAN